MSVILLIVVGAVLYVGMMYLRTFQRMVDELREMRFKCIKSSSDTTTESASPMSNGELKNNFVSMLSYLKEQAA